MKKILLLTLGMLLAVLAGAQDRELKVFLEDYLKVMTGFTLTMEKVQDSKAAVIALQDFLKGMKPLSQRAEVLEKKYKDWGAGLLALDPLAEKDWNLRFAQSGEKLMNAMTKLYKFAMEDPSLMQSLETMTEEMDKIWPGEGSGDEESDGDQ